MKGMGKIWKEAQKMQAEMAKIQAELVEKHVDGSAGGGMVVAKVNGHQEIVSLKIDPEVVNPEDVEMLEDLVVAAVNDGMRKAQEMVAQEMSKVTGGLNIPGLLKE